MKIGSNSSARQVNAAIRSQTLYPLSYGRNHLFGLLVTFGNADFCGRIVSFIPIKSAWKSAVSEISI
jgi:hypothetical protein